PRSMGRDRRAAVLDPAARLHGRAVVVIGGLRRLPPDAAPSGTPSVARLAPLGRSLRVARAPPAPSDQDLGARTGARAARRSVGPGFARTTSADRRRLRSPDLRRPPAADRRPPRTADRRRRAQRSSW